MFFVGGEVVANGEGAETIEIVGEAGETGGAIFEAGVSLLEGSESVGLSRRLLSSLTVIEVVFSIVIAMGLLVSDK